MGLHMNFLLAFIYDCNQAIFPGKMTTPALITLPSWAFSDLSLAPALSGASHPHQEEMSYDIMGTGTKLEYGL